METGKHYNYFRDYDPGIGRYIESDPIGLRGGLSTYGYVSAQPLTRLDASGLFSLGFGFGGSATWGDAGMSAGTNVVYDFKNRTTCIQSTICLRYDALGIQATYGGQASGGGGRLCSGTTRSTGFFAAGGYGVSGSYRASDNANDSASRGIGQLGFGGGAAVGFERCKITLVCFNESPCCSNPNQCGC